MWSDDICSWVSRSPLVVSPSTDSEPKTANFVWLGFNLPIRRYEAGIVLQVFSILPRENCVRFCKCTSKDTSAWHSDRQLVQIKNWSLAPLLLRNKIKAIPFAASQKLSVHGAEFMHLYISNCCFPPQLISNGCWRVWKMVFALQSKLGWTLCLTNSGDCLKLCEIWCVQHVNQSANVIVINFIFLFQGLLMLCSAFVTLKCLNAHNDNANTPLFWTPHVSHLHHYKYSSGDQDQTRSLGWW